MAMPLDVRCGRAATPATNGAVVSTSEAISDESEVRSEVGLAMPRCNARHGPVDQPIGGGEPRRPGGQLEHTEARGTEI